ncbi:MAG TPA: outer membrane protein transport protein [bacterium]|nr:outer membrane protein transport protein [bacterium]
MKSLWNTRIRAFSAAALVLATLSEVYAGGFSIYEQGSRATAQAGAVVARPWDASAAFYNPAGLAFYGGTPGTYRFYVGVTPVQSLSKFTGLDSFPGRGVHEEAKAKWFPPFYAYGVYQINENMAAGLSITTPFGLGTEWKNPNNTYSGRFRSLMANIEAVYISPVISYKVNNMIGVGAGVDFVYSRVELRRHQGIDIFDGEATKKYDVADIYLKGEDKLSMGFHVSAYAKINENLSFGADYKHSIKNDYEGHARFRQIKTGYVAIDNSVAANFANDLFGGMRQEGNTSVTFPSSLVIGAAYKPMEKLTVEADFALAGWSVFKEVEILFPNQRSIDATTGDTIKVKSILKENYDDTWQIRLGAEYDVNERLQVRAGYIFDKTPAPTETVNPLLPDANRNDFSIGVGYKINDNWHVDAAYMAVIFSERSTKGKNVDNFDGVYNSHVNLFSLGFGYTFGN